MTLQLMEAGTEQFLMWMAIGRHICILSVIYPIFHTNMIYMNTNLFFHQVQEELSTDSLEGTYLPQK